MAQGNQNVTLWEQSAARAKYDLHNGQPLIGVSGDEGDGFIVPLRAPDWFHNITDEGARDNVFRAMASHALRVGQAKLKASKTPGHDVALEGVNSALNGGYKPGREVDNGIIGIEAARMFSERVTALAKQSKPTATQAEIDATITKYADSDKGKALLAQFRQQIVERGTYVVNRKGKATASAALDLGDLGA